MGVAQSWHKGTDINGLTHHGSQEMWFVPSVREALLDSLRRNVDPLRNCPKAQLNLYDREEWNQVLLKL